MLEDSSDETLEETEAEPLLSTSVEDVVAAGTSFSSFFQYYKIQQNEQIKHPHKQTKKS